jgi:hypothetical protein
MTLRDHQPDIRFQGDALKRGLHRAEARVSCLARNIRIEIIAIRNSEDEGRKSVGRTWIKQALAARREAQQSAIAYRGLIAERDMQASVLGQVAL